MRLLSFLTQIEQAVLAGNSALANGTWDTSRIVNFHHGFARLALTERPGAEGRALPGTIFLQVFTLANGSTCVKVSLGWKGVEECPVFSVYSSPAVNWKQEAARIGSAWLKVATGQTSCEGLSDAAPQLLRAG